MNTVWLLITVDVDRHVEAIPYLTWDKLTEACEQLLGQLLDDDERVIEFEMEDKSWAYYRLESGYEIICRMEKVY